MDALRGEAHASLHTIQLFVGEFWRRQQHGRRRYSNTVEGVCLEKRPMYEKDFRSTTQGGRSDKLRENTAHTRTERRKHGDDSNLFFSVQQLLHDSIDIHISKEDA